MLATGDAIPGFDPEDIFGVRRALASLPEGLRDEFLAAWVELGERTDCDVEAIQRAARDAARTRARDGSDPMETAWSTVASAMDAYLEWRVTSGGAGSSP